jgi:hypothetical protein
LEYEFLWEVFFVIDRIKQSAHAWRKFYENTRRCIVRRFRCGLIYMLKEDTLSVQYKNGTSYDN